jgi:hypothetical protein
VEKLPRLYELNNSIYIILLLTLLSVLPKVNVGEPLREVRLGDAVTLICDVQTGGAVDITWDRVKGRLSPYVVDDGYGYLGFPHTTIQDAGKYRCIARSAGGMTEAFVDLVILGEYSLLAHLWGAYAITWRPSSSSSSWCVVIVR